MEYSGIATIPNYEYNHPDFMKSFSHLSIGDGSVNAAIRMALIEA